MKKLVSIVIAQLALVGPLSATASAQDTTGATSSVVFAPYTFWDRTRVAATILANPSKMKDVVVANRYEANDLLHSFEAQDDVATLIESGQAAAAVQLGEGDWLIAPATSDEFRALSVCRPNCGNVVKTYIERIEQEGLGNASLITSSTIEGLKPTAKVFTRDGTSIEDLAGNTRQAPGLELEFR